MTQIIPSYLSQKLLCTDIDDTILQCADFLQQFLEEEFGLFSEHRLKDHHNIPKLFNLSQERTLEFVAAFHRSKIFGQLPPLPCAAVVLPELHRAGYEFVAITACLGEPETVQARLNNLHDAFGFEWRAVHCIGLKSTKADVLNDYPASIWVDDLAHHAEAGIEAGHQSFLIDKPYNQMDIHPEVIRVTDWHELMKFL